MRRISPILFVAIIGCGGGGGSNPDGPGGGGDGPGGGGDAGADAPPAPAMITISGVASARGLNGTTPVQGATVGAYRATDDTNPVATATTDAQGGFSLTITTGGTALDGYLKATKMNYVDTYLYPAAPIAADQSMIPVNMLTTNNYQTLSTFAQGNQQPGNGLVAVEVLDGSTATAMPVAGATIASTPAASVYRYDGANGLPSSTATSTAADGVGYMFNVPPGAATVSATKTGINFVSHGVKSWADQLTTTLITP